MYTAPAPDTRAGILEPVKRMFRWIPLADEIEQHVVGHCDTMLDVGCGVSSPVQQFARKLKHTVGFDAHQPAIDAARAAGIHHDYVCADVRELDRHFAPRSFDCVVALDLIEHLEKADGLQLLDSIERIARKRVIVFTPNGFVPQGAYGGNDFQIHRSGWTPDEMRARGYRVRGYNGWKPLRGELSDIKWKPYGFFFRLSNATQKLVQEHPEHAFQIVCIKDVAGSA
jgi:hypothetical protein